MLKNDVLFIIIPCFNEEQVLTNAAQQLKQKLLLLVESGKVSPQSKILFVDDGSTDTTWDLISDIHEKDNAFSGIRLATNAGHQNALLAGLYKASEICDVTITIDADLQQDINAIESFLEKYYSGCDIVYGIRNTRKTDGIFKKTSALLFYKIMSILGVKIIKNHADYRLLSKKAILALKQFKEVHLFLRGIIPAIGFKTDVVYFDVKDRFAGTSKYTLGKMISLALNGITSFSVKPIRFITLAGFLTFTISLIISIYYLVQHFLGTIPLMQGWTTTVLSIWMIGGLQLLAIGIIGEYIGKSYFESKERPKFIIWEFLNKE